jgi:predicted small metal-binding protein
LAYSIKCADAGLKCAGSFTAETEAELLEHVKIHAAHAHANMPSPPPEMVKKLIKQT